MGNELVDSSIHTREMNLRVRRTENKPSKKIPVGRGMLGEMGRELSILGFFYSSPNDWEEPCY